MTFKKISIIGFTIIVSIGAIYLIIGFTIFHGTVRRYILSDQSYYIHIVNNSSPTITKDTYAEVMKGVNDNEVKIEKLFQIDRNEAEAYAKECNQLYALEIISLIKESTPRFPKTPIWYHVGLDYDSEAQRRSFAHSLFYVFCR